MMLVTWMLYAIAMSAIVAGGTLALDRVAEIWRMRRRPIWLAALVIAAAGPALTVTARRSTSHRAAESIGEKGGVERLSVIFHQGASANDADWLDRLASVAGRIGHAPAFNRCLSCAWLLATLVLLGRLSHGALDLHRARHAWRPVRLDGRDVMISDDAGPAVVGLMRPRVVLPSWVLSLDDGARQLMLDHEAEHLRAGDPAVLLAAALIAAFLPWNPFVAWIVRRLRLALEIDCDARVLARHARPREYGLLLITVGARANGALQWSASLAEPRLFLERRIIAMTTSRHTRPIVASLPFLAIAALAAAAAAQTPRPTANAATAAAATAPAAAPASVVGEASASYQFSPIAVPPPTPPISPRPEKRAAAAATEAGAPTATVLSVNARRSWWPVPVDTIREWVRVHHPTVLVGDPSINYVYIVVDAHDRYVASMADSVPAQIVSSPRPDSDHLGARTVLHADTIVLGDRLAVSAPSRDVKPIMIVDGVRVGSIDGVNPATIKNVEVLKGQAAIQTYGPDAVNGVVVIETSLQTQLRRLGVDETEIQAMDLVRFGPGRIGRNALRLMIVKVARER